MLVALQALGADQLVQERFVGQVGLGRFERQVLVQAGDGRQLQGAQLCIRLLKWRAARPHSFQHDLVG